MKTIRTISAATLALAFLLPLAAPAQTVFNWTNTANNGFWSTAGTWTNGAAPANGGSSDTIINFFTNNTALLSTNDLGNATYLGFRLNGLNFSNSTVTVSSSGANSNLVFMSNGGTLPSVNLYSANNDTIASALVLSNTTTFGGTGSGILALNGVATGPGGLVKSGNPVLVIGANNTYTGGTTNNGGVMIFGTGGSLYNNGTTAGSLVVNSGGVVSNLNITVGVGAAVNNRLAINGGWLIWLGLLPRR